MSDHTTTAAQSHADAAQAALSQVQHLTAQLQDLRRAGVSQTDPRWRSLQQALDTAQRDVWRAAAAEQAAQHQP